MNTYIVGHVAGAIEVTADHYKVADGIITLYRDKEEEDLIGSFNAWSFIKLKTLEDKIVTVPHNTQESK